MSDCRACDRFVQSTWVYCPHCGADQSDPVESDSAAGATEEVATDGGHVEGKPRLSCGDRVRDSDNDDEDAYVYVVEQLDESIDEYVLYQTDHGSEQTVYDYSRGEYDADEPVVRVVFEESLIEFLHAHTLTRDEVLDICHDLDVEKLDTRWGFLNVYAYPRSRLSDPEDAVAADGNGVDAEESRVPPGIGDRLGPRYPGNLDYGRNDRIPTNYGTVSIDSETIWRFWNGAKQEVVDGHWEATCPCCYTEHVVEGVSDEARFELWNTVLDCCDGVRWLPPSDYLDPCSICGQSHRERRECTAPALRDPFPDIDEPAECTSCGYSVTRAENIPSPDGSCPDCESNAVRIGGDTGR